MKAVASIGNEQSSETADALRLAVDTTPAFIHTGRPDGYLDYFNRGWLDFLGKSLEEVCGWQWTDSIHPEDVAGIVTSDITNLRNSLRGSRAWQMGLQSETKFFKHLNKPRPKKILLGIETC